MGVSVPFCTFFPSRAQQRNRQGQKGRQTWRKTTTTSRCWTRHLQKVEILNARCGVGRIRQAAVAACCPFAWPDDVPCHPCHLCLPFQCTAHQCFGWCICFRVRPCLSPELVSLVSLTFHFSDELICGVVFVWVFLFACLGLPLSLFGSCSSDVLLALEPALLLCSPSGPS